MISDRILGATCCIIGVAFAAYAARFETAVATDPLGPGTFPIIIGIVLVAASSCLLAKPSPEPNWPTPFHAFDIAFAVSLLVAYALILEELGFLVSTVLAAALLSWRLGARVLAASLVGVVIAAALYAAFHIALGLSLPRAPWEF